MIQLSIQISVTSGKYLKDVLSSIRYGKAEGIEIIVVNSSENPDVSKYCNEFGAIEIRKKCGLLQSRYLGAMSSRGVYSMILDETRALSKGLLESVLLEPHPVIAFPEIRSGYGFLNHLDQLDKDIISRDLSYLNPENPLAIPRFYYTYVIKEAFSNIRKKLSSNVFEKVVAKDDRIIFYEVSKIVREPPILSAYPILHLNNTNILAEFKKYFRYGNTSRMLMGTDYEFMTKISDRARRLDEARYFPVIFLYMLRVLAYELGFIL